jgi:SAM-dependent methyltransferase
MGISHYDWPDYYDIVNSGLENDVEFYVNLARETDGKILELGCGTGRVTIPIARNKKEIIGLDSNPYMLEWGKRKAKMARTGDYLQFVEGDMREFWFEETFSLIIIPYRTFLHLLTVKEQIAALANIYRHLKQGGLLALNVFVPHIKLLYEEDNKSSTRGIYRIPGSEDSLVVWDYTRFDHFTQIAEIIRQYERINKKGEVIEKIISPLNIRYIYPFELHHLLKLTGFKVVQKYGDFYKSAFGPESKELIIVARKE